jgi:hypothetical protein
MRLIYSYILLLSFLFSAPISDASVDQVTTPGEVVTLDGSGSYEPGNPSEALTFEWVVPSGIDDFSSTTSAEPTFTAPDESGEYTFTLTVQNESGDESMLFDATDLFFTEYNDSHESNRLKYIEIYNGTGGTIDLDDYEIWLVKDGELAIDGDYWGVLMFNSLDGISAVDPDVVIAEPDEFGEDEVNMMDFDSLEDGESKSIILTSSSPNSSGSAITTSGSTALIPSKLLNIRTPQ